MASGSRPNDERGIRLLTFCIPASAPGDEEVAAFLLPDPDRAENRACKGLKLDCAELEKLLERVERLIGSCEPREAEYWRGYRRGVLYHCRGRMEESPGDHAYFLDVATRSCGDSRLDAYARGYRDGCRGGEPGRAP